LFFSHAGNLFIILPEIISVLPGDCLYAHNKARGNNIDHNLDGIID